VREFLLRQLLSLRYEALELRADRPRTGRALHLTRPGRSLYVFSLLSVALIVCVEIFDAHGAARDSSFHGMTKVVVNSAPGGSLCAYSAYSRK